MAITPTRRPDTEEIEKIHAERLETYPTISVLFNCLHYSDIVEWNKIQHDDVGVNPKEFFEANFDLLSFILAEAGEI